MNSKKVKGLLSKSGKRAVFKGTLAMAAVKLFVLIPLFLLAWITRQTTEASQTSSEVLAVTGLVGVGIMLLTILLIRQEYRQTNLPAYMENERLRMEIADKLAHAPLEALDKHTLSQLSEHFMRDTDSNEKMVARILPNLYSAAIAIPISAIFLAMVNLPLAAGVFAMIPIALLLLLATMGIQTKLTMEQIPVKRKGTEKLYEYVEGLSEIRAEGVQKQKQGELKSSLQQAAKKTARMELTSGVCVAGAEVLMQLGTGIVVYLVSIFLSRQEVNLAEAVLFLAVVFTVYGPVSEVFAAIPGGMYFHKNTQCMRETLALENMKGEACPKIETSEIQFENVSFFYQKKQPAVENVSFRLREGTITALVGPSGCGKTTVANLLLRFLEPQEGRILLDGNDICHMKPDWYLSQVSCVFQDVILFGDTVMENIRIGRRMATDEEVLQAARLAYCDDFIARLPQGYQTVLEENGQSLSGGERQRLAIARAILKNAKILILDEPTSHLDAENEEKVQQALSGLLQGKTVLMIAHRLHNIANADQILVLEEGRLTGMGSHEELLKENELYRHLWELQEEELTWELEN